MRSNPFAQMMNIMAPMMGQMNPMMGQMMGGMQPPIDKNLFRQAVPSLNDNILAQLAAQARTQGISEEDIEKGMEFLKKLR